MQTTILGEGRTPLPALNRERASGIVKVILYDVAERASPSPRHGHPEKGICGEFIYYFGKCHWRRGSDLSERIYATVEILRHANLTMKEACAEVADILGGRIGRSKRGRPRRSPRPEPYEMERRIEIVRGTYNQFKQRHPFKAKRRIGDPITEKWFRHAAWIAQGCTMIANTYAGAVLSPAIQQKVSIACKVESFGLRVGFDS